MGVYVPGEGYIQPERYLMHIPTRVPGSTMNRFLILAHIAHFNYDFQTMPRCRAEFDGEVCQ
jgi:hypothetical protein